MVKRQNLTIMFDMDEYDPEGRTDEAEAQARAEIAFWRTVGPPVTIIDGNNLSPSD
jgi:hypothetical protein